MLAALRRHYANPESQPARLAARLSELVCDHVAGAAATQVHAGPPAAVSVSRSHQSTSLALSVPTQAHPSLQPHNLMKDTTLLDT